MGSLDAAHKKGVVHGRIHPSLIRVTKEGEAVLLGFCDPMQDAALEVFGDAAVRVPGYAPVEQYVDQGGFGAETDIYSIAAVIYELVTGHKVPAFYERLSEENPEGRDILMPPAYYNGTIMDYQSKALIKALSIYHFDRYHSLSEFSQAVSEEEFEGTIRIREKPVKFVERLKYHRIILWGAALCIAFLVIFLVPKGIRYLGALDAKQFYEELEDAEVYEQCRMIAGLSEKKRNNIANDYVQMEEEGRHTILYLTNHGEAGKQGKDEHGIYGMLVCPYRREPEEFFGLGEMILKMDDLCSQALGSSFNGTCKPFRPDEEDFWRFW